MREIVVETVRELIEQLKLYPQNAMVWTGCIPGQDRVEVSYDAEADVVRLVGPCDGEEGQ